MDLVAKRYQNQLERIKNNVSNAYQYFNPNYRRYNKFRNFVFNSTLSETERSALLELEKPDVEFNVLEAYISRLRGEFSKQEPSIAVMPDDGTEVDPEVIKTVENHVRHILFDANKDGCEYNVYTDSLSGGFSVMKVWTEYAHSMSMNQLIRVGRAFDPTLCGFDPLAQLPHKGDGRFCFELYPKSKSEFEEQYPNIDVDDFEFTRKSGEFAWSYQNGKEDIILICDYYEKKKKRVKIVQLANDKVMTIDDYKMFIEQWENMGLVEQPPAMVGSRWTEIETICRFRVVENTVIEYVETNFSMLPLVFVDGNSVLIRESENESVQLMTRPYVYQALGAQRLKNFAGQSLANELENIIQHKFIVAQESLPEQEEYLKSYDNMQKANTIVYNAFDLDNPDKPIPPPREIVRTPIPAEISSAFMGADTIIQAELGNYDAALGVSKGEMSGIAFIESATQSNSAAMPYVVGFLQALNQIAEIIVDLIPKYYVTPRTIPIVKADGQKDYVKINAQGQPSMNYDENALQVKVSAGVNFQIQKNRALQQCIAMMQASPLFAQFMNEEGLEILLDNMEFRGVDLVKQRAGAWMENLKKQKALAQQAQQQQAQAAAQQPNPIMIEAELRSKELEMQASKNQTDAELKAAQVAIDKQNSDINYMKAMAQVANMKDEMAMEMAKSQAEETRAAVDLAIKHSDMEHSHAKEAVEFAHKFVQDTTKQDAMNTPNLSE